MASNQRSRIISLIGAVFFFVAFVVFLLAYTGGTIPQLEFATTGEKEIVITLSWLVATFLIAFGLLFLRDYYRT